MIDGNVDQTRDEEPAGGESACWAHLLDEEGHMPDRAEQPRGEEPATP